MIVLIFTNGILNRFSTVVSLTFLFFLRFQSKAFNVFHLVDFYMPFFIVSVSATGSTAYFLSSTVARRCESREFLSKGRDLKRMQWTEKIVHVTRCHCNLSRYKSLSCLREVHTCSSRHVWVMLINDAYMFFVYRKKIMPISWQVTGLEHIMFKT